ncbi:hypothetical protein JCM8202v2_001604 [Rhodotorula sphaerocarpa]
MRQTSPVLRVVVVDSAAAALVCRFAIRREEAWRPAAPSPRRIRQRSWSTRLRDGPSNALLALETRLADLSFDSAGYPLGIALNALHLLVRLPSFYAALPALSELWPGASAATGTDASSVQAASRYARRMATADARLEALQRQAAHSGAQGWIRWTAWISFALVLLSVANAAYLATRRRQYQMVLRRDPLSSPNARSAMLAFTPDRPPRSFAQKLRAKASELAGWSSPPVPDAFPVQELNVWVPDRAIWSLRVFTLYSPPVALLYHFLSPSTFLICLLCGSSFSIQTLALVYLYTTLVSDRAALQSEVMHEYNAKFVHPRVFVPKRDAAVSTNEAEMVSVADWRRLQQRSVEREGSMRVGTPQGMAARRAPAGLARGTNMRDGWTSQPEEDVHAEAEEEPRDDPEEEEEVIRRGSGRKVRRRQSEAPTSALSRHRVTFEDDEADDADRSGTVDSPVPPSGARRTRKARASMFG